MTPDSFTLLVEKFITGDCTAEERNQLQQLLDQPEYQKILAHIMDQQLEQQENPYISPDSLVRIQEKITAHIRESRTTQQQEKKTPARSIFMMRRWIAAAVVLAIFSLLAVYFLHWKQSSSEHPLANTPAIIEAGKEGAILTLADGSSIVLDSLGNGIVAAEKGSEILLQDGKLIYQNKNATELAYNTISTPKGRQFNLLLEDGTRVWLNAESSLRFPIAFTESERQVEITGEAYFEVASDKSKKFLVNLPDGLKVEVLGTHFNINAYQNESSVQTTLVAGSVKVISHSDAKIISPGQQAEMHKGQTGLLQINKQVDVAKVIAWKNGVFDFNNASLYEIMRQLERWYNIEVEYAPGIRKYEFVGKMDRGLSLQEVLKGLELSEVHFEIKSDRKILVKP